MCQCESVARLVPNLLEELDGISKGSGVNFDQLMAVSLQETWERGFPGAMGAGAMAPEPRRNWATAMPRDGKALTTARTTCCEPWLWRILVVLEIIGLTELTASAILGGASSQMVYHE